MKQQSIYIVVGYFSHCNFFLLKQTFSRITYMYFLESSLYRKTKKTQKAQSRFEIQKCKLEIQYLNYQSNDGSENLYNKTYYM